MITILGKNVSEVRPQLIKQPIIRKKDLPQPRYDKSYQSKTIKECTGKVIAVCVKLKNGAIRAMLPPCTHIDVILEMVTDVNNVLETGWQLDNENYLWR